MLNLIDIPKNDIPPPSDGFTKVNDERYTYDGTDIAIEKRGGFVSVRHWVVVHAKFGVVDGGDWRMNTLEGAKKAAVKGWETFLAGDNGEMREIGITGKNKDMTLFGVYDSEKIVGYLGKYENDAKYYMVRENGKSVRGRLFDDEKTAILAVFFTHADAERIKIDSKKAVWS